MAGWLEGWRVGGLEGWVRGWDGLSVDGRVTCDVVSGSDRLGVIPPIDGGGLAGIDHHGNPGRRILDSSHV